MNTPVHVVSISRRLWFLFTVLLIVVTLAPTLVALEKTRASNQVMLQWASMLTKVQTKQRSLEAIERNLQTRAEQREKDLAQLESQIRVLHGFIRSVRAR